MVLTISLVKKEDGITQPVNDVIHSFENFVSEPHRAKLLPDLLYGVHFRLIDRDPLQGNIVALHGNLGNEPLID